MKIEYMVVNKPKAAIVLMNVIVMLSDTSPPSSKVYALLAEPPGEQPRAKNPNDNAGPK